MKLLRSVSILLLLPALALFGPATIAAGVPDLWEDAANACIQGGGDVTEDGRCGGGLTFDNCYESQWQAVCEDYCFAGVDQIDGNGPPYWCTCNPCS